MTDPQIEKVLAEGYPIAAVLLSRGGWLKSEEVLITLAFPPEPEHPKGYQPAVWRVDMMSQGLSWHAVFVEASSIVGVSVDCSRTALDEQPAIGAV
jgi:hypothetical protein